MDQCFKGLSKLMFHIDLPMAPYSYISDVPVIQSSFTIGVIDLVRTNVIGICECGRCKSISPLFSVHKTR